ncbi:MAG TPA: ABC transporter ATP-binding protein [Acidimicrobiia bacterium]|jgi:ABC-2 type transport system ATP-binding protein|nr:ABC transporter ATP-binding protein [Acidimicrobiia bacterium]
MTAALKVDGLVRRFGDLVAVDGVSFAVSEGETYGLLGPNGAGKTTTISMISGLLSPDAGSVQVMGEKMDAGSRKAKSAIGLVPQELALYPDLTGEENLHFFGRLYGMDRAELSRRTSEVLEVVGLAARGDDKVSEYSGGMKRRLNIAVGLLHRPRLLILDEPTVGVDPQSRNSILEAVEVLSGEGISVLYTTHYMEEAERLCDRVGIIDEGRLVAEGTRRELVAQVGQLDRVVLRGKDDMDAAAAALATLPGVVEVGRSDRDVTVLARDASELLPALMSTATSAGMSVTGVEVEEPDLEAVFLHLTGKALRDR